MKTNNIINKIINRFLKIILSPVNYGRFIGVTIGNGCLISSKAFPSEPYLITIGNNVRIAKNVSFFTHGGIWTFRKKYPNLDHFGKIKIKDNTYIGEGVYILPGVEIGQNCVIGAGTVVSKSIPDDCIVVGNPCRVVTDTRVYLKKINKLSFGTKGLSYEEKKAVLMKSSDSMFLIKPYLNVE